MGNIKRIAATLGVPTTASPDDIRMEVLLPEASAAFILQDDEGEFLTVAEVEPDEDEPGGRDPTPDRDDVEALHAEVETLRQETRRLQKEVEHQKERFKDLWRANCQSLTKQEEKESASTFIRRLERTFQVAYGHDRMLSETRNTFMGSCRRDCCMSLCEHLQCREHKAVPRFSQRGERVG